MDNLCGAVIGVYDFRVQKEVGLEAELEVAGFLRTKSGTIDVRVVRDDIEYRGRDVHLIWTRRYTKNIGGVPTEVQRDFLVGVKGDTLMAKTGNFFFETRSVVEQDKEGWLETSDAEILAYLSMTDSTLYLLPMHQVRCYLEENQGRLKEKLTTTQDVEGVAAWQSRGYVVSAKHLLKEPSVKVKKVELDAPGSQMSLFI